MSEPCLHLSLTGTDQTPIDPSKRWRCDECGRVFVKVPVESRLHDVPLHRLVEVGGE